MNEWFDAEHHAERAHRHFEAGEWVRALEEIRLALRVNPDQSEWHFGMGLTLDALERYEEAAHAFEQVLCLRGEDAETMLHLGVDLIRSNQPRRALEVFERVASRDPNSEPSYCHRIVAYTQLGDHESAELMFYMARQIVRACPMCYDNLAESLAIRGDLERATWCWQQTLELDPDFPDVNANLARTHWRLGQLERARQYFLRQLRTLPGDLGTLLALGVLLIEMERYDEAGEKFRRTLEHDPTLAEAHFYLGELSLLSGHLDAAESRFERASRLDPDRPGPRAGLARIALQRRHKVSAREYLKDELHCDGHTPEQKLELSRLLIQLDMPSDAVMQLSCLMDDRPDKASQDPQFVANVLLCRGAALMMSGRLDQGIRDSRRAIRLDPENALAMHNLVLAYFDSRRFKRAWCWLRRALALCPAEPQLRRLHHRLRRRVILAACRQLIRSALFLPWFRGTH